MKKIMIISMVLFVIVLSLSFLFFYLLFSIKVEEEIEVNAEVKEGRFWCEIPETWRLKEGDTLRVECGNKILRGMIVKKREAQTLISVPLPDTSLSLILHSSPFPIGKKIFLLYLQRLGPRKYSR
ncbi:hypothetical protein DRQ18_05390 [bacterium]|nr:MAG: hypothetical protein DRQ18_05390 [bacterium]